MEITWFGHASFRLQVKDGTRLIIDPYESGAFGGAIGYGKINEEAEAVITSHAHADHNYTQDIRGTFTLMDRPGEFTVKSFKVKTLPTFHDSAAGRERGKNLISVIEAEGLRVVHLGDLGHLLSGETVKALGEVHVLLIPVGGFFTLDAQGASKVMEQIDPWVTIPMHYRTERCSLPISGVEEFLKGKKNVVRLGKSVWQVDANSLPTHGQIIVLEPAR
ncbi:MAG TPA: MBL fold metallo-hydrolase [Syntrophales bacterium]|nr:MBL fold metallo-hydrolase [Syntrophales bacterium]HOL59397.1 MBL fold metallo-hydrolase [Syntrophales bacterium]HPO35554.1 MBL fold metallo-hydrolase [Syntrophales bacterium]